MYPSLSTTFVDARPVSFAFGSSLGCHSSKIRGNPLFIFCWIRSSDVALVPGLEIFVPYIFPALEFSRGACATFGDARPVSVAFGSSLGCHFSTNQAGSADSPLPSCGNAPKCPSSSQRRPNSPRRGAPADAPPPLGHAPLRSTLPSITQAPSLLI